jgi:hypothetical protein
MKIEIETGNVEIKIKSIRASEIGQIWISRALLRLSVKAERNEFNKRGICRTIKILAFARKREFEVIG